MGLADDSKDVVPGALEGGAGGVHCVFYARVPDQGLDRGDFFCDRGRGGADGDEAEVCVAGGGSGKVVGHFGGCCAEESGSCQEEWGWSQAEGCCGDAVVHFLVWGVWRDS